MVNLKALFKRKDFVNIILNTAGTYLGIVFALTFVLILTHVMSRDEYGKLGLLLTISYVLASVLEFGTTQTIYSYLPELLTLKSPRVYPFIKSTVYYQTLISTGVVALLALAFPALDRYFLHMHAALSDMYLTAAAILFFVWQNTVTNILFAAKKFLSVNILLNVSNLIKTLVLLAMYWTNTVSIGGILIIFGLVGPFIFFGFLLWRYRELTAHVVRASVSRDEFRFQFTLTNFIANQFQYVGMRVDLILLSHFNMVGAVADYGLAQKIVLTIIATIVSVTQVLSPTYSHIKTKLQVMHELKHTLMYLMLPAGLFLALAITPDFVFKLVFTKKFIDTAPLARIMGLPYIIFIVSQAVGLFLVYTVKKPIYILYGNIAFFIVMVIGCYMFIPHYGAYGPLSAIALGFAIMTGIYLWGAIKEYKNLPA